MGFTLKWDGPAGDFEYSIDGEPHDFTDRERAFAQAVQPAVTALVGACAKDETVHVELDADHNSVTLTFEGGEPPAPPAPPVPGEQAAVPDTPGTPPDQNPPSPDPAAVAAPDPGTQPAGDAQASPASATVAGAEQSGQDGPA